MKIIFFLKKKNENLLYNNYKQEITKGGRDFLIVKQKN